MLVSGLVMDYHTDEAVSSATVYAIDAVSGDIVASTETIPFVGYFLLEVTAPADLVYLAYSEFYEAGYARQLPPSISYVNLFLRKVSSDLLPTVSGSLHNNISNSMLTGSVEVTDMQANLTNLYVSTRSSLEIIDLNTRSNVGYLTYSGGFTCLDFDTDWCSDTVVYLGTADSGVLGYNIPSSYTAGDRDLSSSLYSKYSVASGQLQSNTVQCMSLASAAGLVVGGVSGVDYITSSGGVYHYAYNEEIGTTACWLTPVGDIYYSPTNSGVYVKRGPIVGDWVIPDYVIQVSGGGGYSFPLPSNYINDISVTTHSGANNVYIATTSGLMVYEEVADLNVSASGAKVFLSFP